MFVPIDRSVGRASSARNAGIAIGQYFFNIIIKSESIATCYCAHKITIQQKTVQRDNIPG